jgi:putative membrane protein
MLALWFWTYASSVLAHAAFLDLPATALGLPASAAWGGVAMGLVVIPLAFRLARR